MGSGNLRPMCELVGILNDLGTPRVLVVGDLILDRYTWGDVERVSPEAPVLVVHAQQDEIRLGGAGSVAMLLAALDSRVSLAGIVGDDAAGRAMRRLLDESQIDASLVIDDSERSTTVKERLIGRAAGRHPHQIVRVDRETRRPIAGELERHLIEVIAARLPAYDAVCIADYGKSVCTPRLLATVLSAAAERGISTLVDPAPLASYDRYARATLLKPNRAEAALASGRSIVTPQDALAAGQALRRRHHAAAVLVTLDAEGMALSQKARPGALFSTRPRQVYDVTGAGDTVLAVLGLCQAAGVALPVAARMANIAAGLQVEKLGVAPVSRGEIRAEMLGTGRTSYHKRISLTAMSELRHACRRNGRKVVFTNGCFDLLHAGHVAHLEQAALLGDVLVVAINSDACVRRLKGPARPVIPQDDRAMLVAALGCVDYVLLFDELTPHELLRALQPDVLAKGGTYRPDEVIGGEIVEAYGGRVCVTDRTRDVSTTAIVASLQTEKSNP